MAERGVGKQGFVAEHGLLTPEQQEAGERSLALVEQHGLRTVRMVWVDQHGAPRCKFMSAADYAASLRSGIDFSGAVLNLDTTNHVFALAFAEGGGLGIPELTGFPDMMLVPDPTTFRVLPWADRTGWVLTDAYFDNGKPVPLDTRHLLRRQVHRTTRKPLVLFTPKRYLRGREAYSAAEAFTTGSFREVLDDPTIAGSPDVRRVVLATGKVSLDLLGARNAASVPDVAVVRVEQLFPWPEDQIAAALSGYANAEEVVWLQEEPRNMGAWAFVRDRLASLVSGDYRLTSVTRVASGSPATGSHAMHDLEQSDLLERALRR